MRFLARVLPHGVGVRKFSTDGVAHGPLHGVKVLELASVLAGPSVAQFLGELGADVIKVENRRTKGDVTRSWLLPGETRDKPSSYFSCCNVAKKSIVVDAGVPRGRLICQQLAAKSDVVIASYKPGDDVKFGFDSKTLRSLKPEMIYAQITGYGMDDDRVGYDALIQAEGGFTYMNGEPGADGRPTKMPVALIDILAAHQLKQAILVALLQRERTGKGAHVHVSLMHSCIASLANQATGYLMAGSVPQRMGSEHPSIVPYGKVFEDREGKPVMLAVGSDSQFKALCDILGCPKLATDERYSKNVARVAHRSELNEFLRYRIRQVDRAEFVEKLNEKKVPGGAIADMRAVFETSQGQDVVMRCESNKPMGLKQVVWTGDCLDPTPKSRPPRYGEHTVHVLAGELGFKSDQIDDLVAQGVIDL